MSNCIVCKQPIEEGQGVDTPSGKVHNGSCLTYFTETTRYVCESQQEEVLQETQLLL